MLVKYIFRKLDAILAAKKLLNYNKVNAGIIAHVKKWLNSGHITDLTFNSAELEALDKVWSSLYSERNYPDGKICGKCGCHFPEETHFFHVKNWIASSGEYQEIDLCPFCFATFSSIECDICHNLCTETPRFSNFSRAGYCDIASYNISPNATRPFQFAGITSFSSYIRIVLPDAMTGRNSEVKEIPINLHDYTSFVGNIDFPTITQIEAGIKKFQQNNVFQLYKKYQGMHICHDCLAEDLSQIELDGPKIFELAKRRGRSPWDTDTASLVISPDPIIDRKIQIPAKLIEFREKELKECVSSIVTIIDFELSQKTSKTKASRIKSDIPTDLENCNFKGLISPEKYLYPRPMAVITPLNRQERFVNKCSDFVNKVAKLLGQKRVSQAKLEEFSSLDVIPKSATIRSISMLFENTNNVSLDKYQIIDLIQQCFAAQYHCPWTNGSEYWVYRKNKHLTQTSIQITDATDGWTLVFSTEPENIEVECNEDIVELSFDLVIKYKISEGDLYGLPLNSIIKLI